MALDDFLMTPSEYNLVMDEVSTLPLNFMENDSQPLFNEQSEFYETDSESKYNPKRKKAKKKYDFTYSTNTPEVLPCLEPYAGNFDFQLLLPADSTTNRWAYSKILKKVFIDMDKVLALQFKWNYVLKTDMDLYVRAMPVYTSHDSLKTPVKRCPIHRLPDDGLNKNFPYLEHVVRCEHNGTVYDTDEATKRYSCITPLSRPQAGSEATTLMYKFVCKTSCSGGMDRQPICVIFTLEDCNGMVYGRQQLAVKICSCPKRDKLKDENNEAKKQSCFKTADATSNMSGSSSQLESLQEKKGPEYLNSQSNSTERKCRPSDGAFKSVGKVKKTKDEDTQWTVRDLLETIRQEHNITRDKVEQFNKETKAFFLRKSDDSGFGRFIELQMQGIPPHIMLELQKDILKLIYEKKLEIVQQNPDSSVVSFGFALPSTADSNLKNESSI